MRKFYSMIFLILTLLYLLVSNIYATQSKLEKVKDTIINETYESAIKQLPDYADVLLEDDRYITSYDSLSNHLVSLFSKKNIFIKPQKTDMFWNFLLYNELSILYTALDKIKQNIQDKIPSIIWEKDGINNIQITTEDYNKNINFLSLQQKMDTVKKLADEIYDFCYNYELENFKKNNGFDIKDTIPITDITINYMARKPTKEDIYDLSNTKVLQTTPKGILVYSQNIFDADIYPDKNIFIYTNNNFVDNEDLTGKFVKYVGKYTYKSISNTNKTVYAFNFLNFDWNTIDKNKYLFYPKLSEPTEDFVEEYFNKYIKR